jgi:hypothetical protein
MDYYAIKFSEEYTKKNGRFGIVDSLDLDSLDDDDLIEDGKPFPIETLSNVSFHFESSENIEAADFQMMYFTWRLVSERFYNLLETYADENRFSLYPISVKFKDRELQYYIMHFHEKISVINEDKSKFKGNILWDPILDVNKLPFPSIFCYPNSIGHSFCISSRIKMEMQSEGITGCDYRKILIS